MRANVNARNRSAISCASFRQQAKYLLSPTIAYCVYKSFSQLLDPLLAPRQIDIGASFGTIGTVTSAALHILMVTTRRQDAEALIRANVLVYLYMAIAPPKYDTQPARWLICHDHGWTPLCAHCSRCRKVEKENSAFSFICLRNCTVSCPEW